MKKKITASLLVSACTLFVPISCCAEIYSDDFISFEYNADDYGLIMKGGFDSSMIYSYSLDMKNDDQGFTASVEFQNIQKYEEMRGLDSGEWKSDLFSEARTDNAEKVLLEDGNFPEFQISYTDGSPTFYRKLLAFTDSTFVTVCCVSDSSAKGKVCKQFYDSAEVNHGFVDSSLNIPESPHSEYIYANVALSDQGREYMDQAMETLEKYLSFDITADDASSNIKEIVSRSESYADDSEFKYDGELSKILSNVDLYIDLGRDDIIENDLIRIKSLLNEE